MAFDFETVFSSIADFFGSGYVFIIFGILVTLSVVKKLLKLMLIAISLRTQPAGRFSHGENIFFR